MGAIKKLLGQTAIYGLSSIVARVINFFFVPLYSRVLPTGNYGYATEILSYIALLQVVLVMGMETGFFRFANNHKDQSQKIFSTAFISLFFSATSFLLIVLLLLDSISGFTGYPKAYVVLAAGILAMDTITALLFAELRYLEKAWKFAIFKSIKIIFEVASNLVLFFMLPRYFISHPNSILLKIIPPVPDYGYILLAIFSSCVVAVILFIPRILKIKFIFSRIMFVRLAKYSIPLMLAGLPGVANDFISRIFFRFFAPTHIPWQEQLGIFGANLKLAVIMVLFQQMFKYAAEPFYFSYGENTKNRTIYADVMKYYVIFCLLIFLVVAMFADVFVLFLGRNYRSGVDILPIMLIANMFIGVIFNLSMWYKLTDRTKYALNITVIGLIVNVIFNIIFMPKYGYMAAAWGFLVSYLSMTVYSYALGQKYFKIPYDVKTITIYIVFAVLLYLVSTLFKDYGAILRYGINIVLIAAYVIVVMYKEKITFKQILSVIKISKK